jgi:hypothetical protein
MQGAAMGVMGGIALLAWYPDPFRFDVKNTVIPKALNTRHIIGGLKAPMLWSSIVCATYGGVECLMEQLRDETRAKTSVNAAVAGAAAGIVMGSMTKRIDIMATTALGLGMLMGMIEYNGQTMQHDKAKSLLTVRGVSDSVKESPKVQQLKEMYPEYKDL